ncbi:RNA-binding protein [Fictibacillus gelatini]|uniref:YlmH family RNA-binding protein n=1 Tax=Fictibacillus gelatini TaxID=225985 RepID=UPI0003FE6D23|nr:RNA-binding protein [Fictibacillus gelatini]
MSIYQHFRPDEYAFVDQVLEWKEYAMNRYAMKLTDFLDPRQQQIVTQIIGKDADVRLSFWGGSSYCERKRALIYPSYYEPEQSDYEVAAIEVHYPARFVTINHRDVLGAILNIGVKREKFGDILLEDEKIQLIVAREISDYVKMNLQKIGKATVKLFDIAESELIQKVETFEEKEGTVSSLRLDGVLAEVYNLSRSRVVPFIQQGKAKVNWKIIDEPSFQVEEGDYLSLRGFGRSKLIAVEGKTKKEKWRIKYGILK